MRRQIYALGLAIALPGVFLAPAADSPKSSDDIARLKSARIGVDDESLLEFFRQRTLHTSQSEVQRLIDDLGHKQFTRREQAVATLKTIGPPAVPLLRQAATARDAEVRRRVAEALRGIEMATDVELVRAAARMVAARKPAGAARVLIDFMPSLLDEATIHEVTQTLIVVAVRDGKVDPAVIAALTHEHPAVRTAAGAVLARAGPKDREPARALLKDRDPGVRRHVAMALTAAGDREAVPALIALFEELPRNQLWRAEDVLYRLAGEHAPGVALGNTVDSRLAFREAWLAWWKEHGAKADMTRALHEPFRDSTIIILLDQGEVIELDADDKVRFRISRVGFPLDVQSLPGDRVLLAEHGGGRITERLRDGTVLWERKATEPLVAQRLPNGNTFIACKAQMFEVDRDGKEVATYGRPGDRFMRARKMDDGTIACITSSFRYLRLTPEGRVLQELPAEVRTFGGRVDVQPDGRVLIPEMYNGRVVEYDRDGKVLRTFSIQQPIVATRLPNGNTMITSMEEKRAVEFDLAGKTVWQYQANTRVTRAYRR